MNQQQHVLEAHELAFAYGADQPVLRGMNFSAQAGKLLAVLEKVQKRLTNETRRPQDGGNGAAGQGGAGSWQNLSAADREKLGKQLEARQRELQTALGQIDKILTPKQVEFLDNLDFDETPYTVRRPQGMGGMGGSQAAPGAQVSVSPQQLAEMRKQTKAARQRLEKLFTQTIDYLKTRSKAKK
jgi:hypothetical protein